MHAESVTFGKMREHGPILVVDDDDDIRDSLGDFLKLHGYQVVVAANGREALEVLREKGSACVILLDLMMPIMDGYEFLDARSGEDVLATIPVVVITAGSTMRAASIGSTEVLQKPLNLERLLSAVRQHC